MNAKVSGEKIKEAVIWFEMYKHWCLLMGYYFTWNLCGEYFKSSLGPLKLLG